MAQKSALKSRLQQALQITKAPQTLVDTITIADKAVRLLDIVLEVSRAATIDYAHSWRSMTCLLPSLNVHRKAISTFARMRISLTSNSHPLVGDGPASRIPGQEACHMCRPTSPFHNHERCKAGLTAGMQRERLCCYSRHQVVSDSACLCA